MARNNKSKGDREEINLLSKALERSEVLEEGISVHSIVTEKDPSKGYRKMVTYYMGKNEIKQSPGRMVTSHLVPRYSFTTTLPSHKGLITLLRNGQTTKGFAGHITPTQPRFADLIDEMMRDVDGHLR